MKTLHFMMIIALTGTSLLAQPREGKSKELSLSGSYQNYHTESSSTECSGALLVSTRLGFYIVEGLELEPELLFMVSNGSEPAYMLNGNISYNFLSAGKGIPFLLIGYGLANTVPFFNVPLTETKFKIGVLNIGGGIKVFLNEDVAIRFEYRYQNFTGESGSSDYSFIQKVNTRIHIVQFGFSILVR